MDQPVKLAGEGTLGGAPVTLAGSLGAPELLISERQGRHLSH